MRKLIACVLRFLIVPLFFVNVCDAKSVNLDDICNLGLLYNSDYEYFLQRELLEKYLSGKAFDNPKPYSAEEVRRLCDDINEIYQDIMSAELEKGNSAVLTAGAPGAGKTTLLRRDLEKKRSRGECYAYVCPDDVCLKNQTRTYKADIAKVANNSREAQQPVFDKWQPASIAASYLILGHLIREKYSFYFGTTATGPFSSSLFEFFKKQGYKIRLLHISASDDVRRQSVKERDKRFIQATEQEITEKGLLFPQRINDTFLKYADEIEFYFRDEVEQDALLVATWIRNDEGSKYLGTLQIINPALYEKIKLIHNGVAKKLKRPDLMWESSVEDKSEVTTMVH